MLSLRHLLALCLALVLALGIATADAADSWLVANHDAAATNFNPGEHLLSAATVSRLHVVWRQEGVLSAVATDERVYAIVKAVGSGSNVAVFDAATGKVLRTFTAANLHLTDRPGDNPQALAYAQGKLVVGASTALLALDPSSGRLWWRTPGGASVLTVKDRTIYTGKGCQNVPSRCGSLASYAVDLTNGRVRWQHPGNGGALPTLVAGRLYQLWGMYMPSTHVYDAASGRLLATLPLTASWTGDVARSYADVTGGPSGKPDWLGEIGANGKPVWKVSVGHVQGNSRPALAYGTLFLPSNRFHPGVIAVNARNGQVRWGADVGPNVSVAVANHLVYVLHTETGALDILDAASGRGVVHLMIPGYVGYGSLFVSGGTVYVVSGGAGLIALRA